MKIEGPAAVCGDGMKRIVVNFRAGDDWDVFVQQLSELTNDPALGLAAQSQKNCVVLREDRIDQLGNNAFIVANNAGKEFFTGAQFLDEVRAKLVFNGNTLIAAGL